MTPGNTSLVSLVILVCVSPVPGSRCTSGGGGGEAGKLTLRRLVWGQLHQQQQFPLVTTLSSHHEHEQGWRWLGKKKVAAGPTRKNFRFSFPWFFLYGYVYVSLVRSVVCAFIFISSPPPPPLPPPPRLLPPPPPPVAHCYEEEKIIGMFDKLLLSNHVGVTYGELLGAAPRW